MGSKLWTGGGGGFGSRGGGWYWREGSLGVVVFDLGVDPGDGVGWWEMGLGVDQIKRVGWVGCLFYLFKDPVCSL